MNLDLEIKDLLGTVLTDIDRVMLGAPPADARYDDRGVPVAGKLLAQHKLISSGAPADYQLWFEICSLYLTEEQTQRLWSYQPSDGDEWLEARAAELSPLLDYVVLVDSYQRVFQDVQTAIAAEIAAAASDDVLLSTLVGHVDALAKSGGDFDRVVKKIAPSWPTVEPLVFTLPEPLRGKSLLPQTCSDAFKEPQSACRRLQFELAVRQLVPAVRTEIERAIAQGDTEQIETIRARVERMTSTADIADPTERLAAFHRQVAQVSMEWPSLSTELAVLADFLTTDGESARYFGGQIGPLTADTAGVSQARSDVDALVAAVNRDLATGSTHDLLRMIDDWLERFDHASGSPVVAFNGTMAETAELRPKLAIFQSKWSAQALVMSYTVPYLVEQLRFVQFQAVAAQISELRRATGEKPESAVARAASRRLDQLVTTEIGRVVAALHREIDRAHRMQDLDYLTRIKQALQSLQTEWDSRQRVASLTVVKGMPRSLANQLEALAGVDARHGSFLLEQLPVLAQAVAVALASDDEPQTPGMREQYVLDFHLWDAAQQPVLSSLAADGQTLTLGIRNTARGIVKLNALPAGDQHYHFVLRFRKGTLLDPKNIHIEGQGADWKRVFPLATAAVSGDVQELFLRGPDNHVILAGETRLLELHTVQADPGAGTRTTRIELVYQSLSLAGKDLAGHRQKMMSIINQKPPLQAAVYQLPLHAGFNGSNTILNDKASKNTLSLQLTNTDAQKQGLHFSATLPARAKIILAFDVGEAQQRGWGLATLDELAAIVPELHGATDAQGRPVNWEMTFTSEAARPQWVFTPPAGDGITLAAGQALTLRITEITSSLPSGPANLHLRCENVTGYPDRAYALTVQKTPLTYGDRLVRIGGVAPGRALHIEGNDAALRRSGIGINGAGAKLNFGNGELVYLHEDEENKLTIHTGGGLALMGGNVGIGTPVPTLRLAIGDDDTGLQQAGENQLAFYTGGMERLRIDVQGHVGIGTPKPQLSLAIGDDDTGLQQVGKNQLGFYTGNMERLRIAADGNVGIGIAAPSHGLHIEGKDKALRLTGTGPLGSGAKLNFGDADNVYLHEDVDDHLTIHTRAGLTLTTGDSPESVPERLSINRKGEVKANGKIVAVGEENLRIVRGQVRYGDYGPYAHAGSGFSVTAIAAGVVKIAFDPPFNGSPTVTANAPFNFICAIDGRDDGDLTSPNEFYVRTYTPQDKNVGEISHNKAFGFIAVGPA